MDLSRATSRIVGIGARKQSTPQYGARVPHRARRDCIMVAGCGVVPAFALLARLAFILIFAA